MAGILANDNDNEINAAAGGGEAGDDDNEILEEIHGGGEDGGGVGVDGNDIRGGGVVEDGNEIHGGGEDGGGVGEGGNEIRGGGEDGGGVGGAGGAKFQGVHDIIGDIEQEMEVRFMDLDSEGNLYTLSGTDRVQRWYRGQMVQDSWSASKPVKAFVVKRSARCTHAFFAHEKGRTEMWRCYNASQNPKFGYVASLQSGRNRALNVLSCARDPGDNTVSCLCLSDDHNYIYTGSKNHRLYVWFITDLGGLFVESIRGHHGELLSLAEGPQVVFSGSTDGVVRLWKREPRGSTRAQVRHRLIWSFLIVDSIPMRVNAIVFHKLNETSGFLYVGSSDQKVRCWKNLRVDERQADTPGPEVMTFHKGEVTCLASSSGLFVFSGSNDKNICVWRRGDGEEKHTLDMVLTGHQNPIKCIATQLDDWTENDIGAPRRWILYSGSLNALRIWRVHEAPLALQQ